MKVLIIDDDNTSLQLMSIFIKGSLKNVDVALFDDGLKALDYIKSSVDYYPDVLITDIQMPGLNGFELIYRINNYFSDKRTCSPPFRIMLHTSFLLPSCECIASDSISDDKCFLKKLFFPEGNRTCRELHIEACLPKPMCSITLDHICNQNRQNKAGTTQSDASRKMT